MRWNGSDSGRLGWWLPITSLGQTTGRGFFHSTDVHICLTQFTLIQVKNITHISRFKPSMANWTGALLSKTGVLSIQIWQQLRHMAVLISPMAAFPMWAPWYLPHLHIHLAVIRIQVKKLCKPGVTARVVSSTYMHLKRSLRLYDNYTPNNTFEVLPTGSVPVHSTLHQRPLVRPTSKSPRDQDRDQTPHTIMGTTYQVTVGAPATSLLE